MSKSDDLKNRLDELFSKQPAEPATPADAAQPPESLVPPLPAAADPLDALDTPLQGDLQTAFEHLAIGMTMSDLDGRFRRVNNAFSQILGYAPKDLVGRPFQELTHPHDQKVGAEALQAMLNGETRSTRIEKRYLHRDGHPVWVELNVTLIQATETQPAYFLSVVQDVSHQHRTSLLLEKRVRELNCLNDIGHRIDEKPPLEEFLNWAAERIPAAFQYPDVCVAAFDYAGKIYGDRRALEQASKVVGGLRIGMDLVGWLHVAYTETREFVDAESALLGSLVSRISGYIETCRLLEQAGVTLSEARESQQMLTSAINNIPNPIFFLNSQAVYTGANQAFLDYLGKTADQVIGKTVYDMGYEPYLAERFYESDMQLFKNPGVQVYESEAFYADGSRHDVIFYKSTFTNPDGSLGGLVGTMVDISERKQAEARLLEDESRLEEALRLGKMAYWELDVAAQEFIFNEQWFKLYQAAPERPGDYRMPVGYFIEHFMPPEAGDEVGRGIMQALQSEAVDYSYEQEATARFGNGHDGHVQLRYRLKKDEAGRTIGLYGTTQDITERKQADLLLQRRAVELATVAEVSTAIATELDPSVLLQRVVDLTKERFHLYHAHIYQLNPTGDRLVLTAGADEVGRQMTAEGWQISLESEQSLVAQVARSRTGLTVNDVRQDPDFLPNPFLPDTRAELAVPLLAGDQLLGVLDVQSTQVGRFGPEDVRIQEMLAAQVGVALQNARLFAETRQRFKELTIINEVQQGLAHQADIQTIIGLVGDKIKASFDADATFICQYVPSNQMLNYTYAAIGEERLGPASERLSPGIMWQVITTRQPVLLGTWREQAALGAVWTRGDRAITQTNLCVPMIVGGEVRGIVSIQRYAPNGYTNSHLRLLQTLAAGVAITLENASLFAQTQRLLGESERQAQVMTVLNEMGRVLSTSLDQKHVMETIYAYTNRLMEARNFFVALYDAQAGMISFPFAYSNGKPVEITPRTSRRSLTDHVIQTGEPLLLSQDVVDGMRSLGVDVLTYGDDEVAQSWLGVPLKYHERVLGVMAVQSTTVPGQYTERHQELLQAVAAQVSNALILAEQYQQTQRMLGETQENVRYLGALNELAAAVNTAQAEDDMYNLVSRFLGRVSSFDAASVSLVDPGGEFVEILRMSTQTGQAGPPSLKLPFQDSASGQVVLQRRLLSWPEDGDMTLFVEGAQLKDMGVKTSMSAPVNAAGQTIATLNVASTRLEHFADRDRNLLLQISALLGAAVENRRLLDQVQRRARQEQVLREITTQVRASMDVDSILRAAARELGDALGRKTFIQMGGETEIKPLLQE